MNNKIAITLINTKKISNNRRNKVLHLLTQGMTSRQIEKITQMNRLYVTRLYSKLITARILGINIDKLANVDNTEDILDIYILSSLTNSEDIKTLRILLAFLPELREKVKIKIEQIATVSDSDLKLKVIEYISGRAIGS